MKRRLGPLGRIVLYLATISILAGAFSFVTVGATQSLVESGALPARIAGVAPMYGAVYVALTMAILLATWLLGRFLDHRSLADFGLVLSAPWPRETSVGFALSGIVMGAIFVAMLLGGLWRIRAGAGLPAGELIVALVFAFAGFGLVGLNEELVSRGYILQNLELALGTRWAVGLSSALFALAHLANPHASIVPVVGLVGAGLILALLYLWRRRLWLPIGYHLGWNFFEGPVFGFPVSGQEVSGIVRLDPAGPDLLSGGAFGPEASVLALLIEAAGVTLAWWLARRGGLTAGAAAQD
ncbi:MAG: CPBP family intramembrane metalloprotease [Chloroflexi bacterium]|nr:CPBP family intramembrane metalloprotease [Chloroflexota bacterium]